MVNNGLRWLALFPISALAGLAALVCVRFTNRMLMPFLSEVSPPFSVDPSRAAAAFLVDFAGAISFGVAYAYVGFRVAPHHKVTAQWALVSILANLACLVSVATLLRGDYVGVVHTMAAVGVSSASAIQKYRKWGFDD